MFVIIVMMGQLSAADEFWAVPQVRGKGDDYLFVVNPGEAEQALPRRLRCYQSLPQYIEEMASAASRVKGQLMLRVVAEIVSETGGERVEKVRVKMVCLIPHSSRPILSQMRNWKDYSEALPEEQISDPFSEGDSSDPFGSVPD